jgi:chromosome segregation ATPase
MTSKYNFLDDELQVTNSNEKALHICRELAKSRFKDIIKLENENHEQRGQMAILREEIKELNEAMGGLLETSDYWRDECLKLKGLSHKLENEKHKLQKQLDELTHMNQAISMLAGVPRSDEMETLIKDGKRLDWLQSCDLSLHCPNEGEVWRKDGVYRIRQYIDKAINSSNQFTV